MDLRPPELAAVKDEASERNFRRLSDHLQAIQEIAPWLDGNLLEGVSLEAGTTTQVPHKLGRSYRGWWICGGTSNADYPGEGASDDANLFLALTVVGAQTVSVWVY
jgi:hypothetical protein